MSLRELSPTERRCVVPYLEELDGRTGAKWRVGPKLERRFPRKRTPECLLYSKRDRVAVEVKSLFDDQSPGLFGWGEKLQRKLAPVRHGHYMLHVPRKYWGGSFPFSCANDIRLQIDQVGPRIPYGEHSFIRVPVRSRLTRDRDGYSHVACAHAHLHKGKDQLDGRVDGLFFLHDDDVVGELCTDEATAVFVAVLLRACKTLGKSDNPQCWVHWSEEWQINREEGTGVFIPVSTVGDAGPNALRPLLKRALEDGASKFEAQRWAPVHTLLIYLSKLAPGGFPDLQEAFRGVDAIVYEPVDEIWVLYEEILHNLFVRRVGATAPPSPSPPASA